MADPIYGWGSPSKNGPSGSCYDWGWGSKTPAAGPSAKGKDFGWGDKAGAGTTALVVLPIVQGKYFPDNGGVPITLLASWGVVAGKGPYRVQLRESYGAQGLWPKNVFGCWSIRYGQGFACAPSPNMDRLLFSLPAVPPGIYDIIVSWGPGWGTQLVAPLALNVVYRGREQETWELRKGRFPAHYATGPQQPAAEVLLGV